MIRKEFWDWNQREWTDEEREYFESHSEEIVRYDFAYRYPQRQWTKGEQKAFEVIDRKRHHGFTMMEWFDFCEHHTSEEVSNFIDDYNRKHGIEPRKFKPIGPGILYDNVQHQNEIGMRKEHNGTNIFK